MKQKKILAGIVAFAATAGILGMFVFGQSQEPTADEAKKDAHIPAGKYAPKQPIDYSHRLHAGELEIPCEFCHTYARRSRSAGIPALEQCMQCHVVMARDKEPVKKIVEAYENKQPIEWVKVHDLPDYAYFSHKRHVSAGFECQDCHGPVEEMEVLYREAPMTMGWCVTCHLDNLDKGAQVDCWTCHK